VVLAARSIEDSEDWSEDRGVNQDRPGERHRHALGACDSHILRDELADDH
jgi:hypothetical protein